MIAGDWGHQVLGAGQLGRGAGQHQSQAPHDGVLPVRAPVDLQVSAIIRSVQSYLTGNCLFSHIIFHSFLKENNVCPFSKILMNQHQHFCRS